MWPQTSLTKHETTASMSSKNNLMSLGFLFLSKCILIFQKIITIILIAVGRERSTQSRSNYNYIIADMCCKHLQVPLSWFSRNPFLTSFCRSGRMGTLALLVKLVFYREGCQMWHKGARRGEWSITIPFQWQQAVRLTWATLCKVRSVSGRWIANPAFQTPADPPDLSLSPISSHKDPFWFSTCWQ